MVPVGTMTQQHQKEEIQTYINQLDESCVTSRKAGTQAHCDLSDGGAQKTGYKREEMFREKICKTGCLAGCEE